MTEYEPTREGLWSMHRICYSYCYSPGYCTRTSADRWSAFVRWLAAIRDLICALRTAFPFEKPAGRHGGGGVCV